MMAENKMAVAGGRVHLLQSGGGWCHSFSAVNSGSHQGRVTGEYHCSFYFSNQCANTRPTQPHGFAQHSGTNAPNTSRTNAHNTATRMRSTPAARIAQPAARIRPTSRTDSPNTSRTDSLGSGGYWLLRRPRFALEDKSTPQNTFASVYLRSVPVKNPPTHTRSCLRQGLQGYMSGISIRWMYTFANIRLAVWGEKSWSLRSGGEMRFRATLVRYSLSLARAPQAL